ncbi:MAG: fatty acid desaturase [Leptospiraceae bacterium]|nr:fatty acid desaturase [Leptospiraceae bacterium]
MGNSADKKEIRPADFMQRSNFTAFGLILMNWGTVIGLAWISESIQHWAVYIATVWIIGGRMVALAEVMGHDSVHYNLFRKKSWNYTLDFLYFVPIFESWSSYREAHNRHHSDLLTMKDPAMQDYERWGLLSAKPKPWFWMWFIRPLLCWDTPYTIGEILKGLLSDRSYAAKLLLFWIPAVSLFYYLNALDLLLYYWMIPYLWAYPALIFWSEVGEHYKVPADRSRTRNTFGLLEYLFISPHDDRYHAVHHIWARIPSYHQKAATLALLQDDNCGESHGFLDLYRQFKAPLDPVTGQELATQVND